MPCECMQKLRFLFGYLVRNGDVAAANGNRSVGAVPFLFRYLTFPTTNFTRTGPVSSFPP